MLPKTMERKIMETTTKKPVKKTTTKTSDVINEKELMHKTITNLTSIVSQLQHDVKKLKTRLGL